MRTRSVILITAALIWGVAGGAVALLAQPLSGKVASAPAQVDPVRLEAHVKKLSVDLYPRSADQFENLEKAAQYVMAQLKASGARVTVQEVVV